MSGDAAGIPVTVEPAGWRRTFAALRFPNYRLWFTGQLISVFGTWMQMTAQGYLVYDLTRSAAYLGYVAFASGLPTWVFMLYGGVVADRLPRRRLLVITQAGMMLLAVVLAVLTFTGAVQPWHIVILAALLGVANAFDAPARQAFVSELVDRAHLTNAIALNSTMFNTATALGPAAGGLIYAAFGPGFCFTANAVSFVAVILALLRMRLPPFSPKPEKHEPFAEVVAGLRYVATQPVIRVLVALVGVATLLGLSFATLLPAVAVTVFGGDSRTLGFLQSSRGVGSLVGALAVASLAKDARRGRILLGGAIVFPLMLLLFSITTWLPLGLVVLAGIGAAMIVTLNLANALVQTQVTNEMRGRVMGVYMLTFFGVMPLGGLLMGGLAHRFGEPEAIVAGAAVLLVLTALLALRSPRIRALR